MSTYSHLYILVHIQSPTRDIFSRNPRPSRKTGYWVGGATSSPPLDVGVDTIPFLRMNLTRNPELFTGSLTPNVLNCRQSAVLVDGHTKTPRRRMFDTLRLGLVL
jgi:hypothetical protein